MIKNKIMRAEGIAWTIILVCYGIVVCCYSVLHYTTLYTLHYTTHSILYTLHYTV